MSLFFNNKNPDIEKKLKKFIRENYKGDDLKKVRHFASHKMNIFGSRLDSSVQTKSSCESYSVEECEESDSIAPELEKRLKIRDESFAEMLMRKIDQSGMKDSECYTKAHISKQVFSKIRCKSTYHPTKQTVLAFAVALELDFDETVEMLRKAGYAFSQNNYFDIIVMFFIQENIHDIGTINEYLYQYDQILLGNDEK